jgi:hypothetical protein
MGRVEGALEAGRSSSHYLTSTLKQELSCDKWMRCWALKTFMLVAQARVISNISLSTQGQQKQNTSFAFISYPSRTFPFHS